MALQPRNRQGPTSFAEFSKEATTNMSPNRKRKAVSELSVVSPSKRIFDALKNSTEVLCVVMEPDDDDEIGSMQIKEVDQDHATLEHVVDVLQNAFAGVLKREKTKLVVDDCLVAYDLTKRLSYFDQGELSDMLNEMLEHFCYHVNQALVSAKDEVGAEEAAGEESQEKGITKEAFYKRVVQLYGWKSKMMKKSIHATFDNLVKAANPELYGVSQKQNKENHGNQENAEPAENGVAVSKAKKGGALMRKVSQASAALRRGSVALSKSALQSKTTSSGDKGAKITTATTTATSQSQKLPKNSTLTATGMKTLMERMAKGELRVIDIISCKSLVKLLLRIQ